MVDLLTIAAGMALWTSLSDWSLPSPSDEELESAEKTVIKIGGYIFRHIW